MNRRVFIGGVSAFALMPAARSKKVMLQATVSPVQSGVPLQFSYGGKRQIVNTDSQGLAVATFRWSRDNQASVSGTVEGVVISDSTQVIC